MTISDCCHLETSLSSCGAKYDLLTDHCMSEFTSYRGLDCNLYVESKDPVVCADIVIMQDCCDASECAFAAGGYCYDRHHFNIQAEVDTCNSNIYCTDINMGDCCHRVGCEWVHDDAPHTESYCTTALNNVTTDYCAEGNNICWTLLTDEACEAVAGCQLMMYPDEYEYCTPILSCKYETLEECCSDSACQVIDGVCEPSNMFGLSSPDDECSNCRFVDFDDCRAQDSGTEEECLIERIGYEAQCIARNELTTHGKYANTLDYCDCSEPNCTDTYLGDDTKICAPTAQTCPMFNASQCQVSDDCLYCSQYGVCTVADAVCGTCDSLFPPAAAKATPSSFFGLF